MKSPTQIHALPFTEVEAIPPLSEIDHGSLFSLSLRNNTTEFTHGLHRFPAKFIPQIPGWALDQFGSPTSVVVDPFTGSGTVLVEAVLRGGTAIGMDIDPLACLISGAKITSVSADRLEELADQVEAGARRSRGSLRPPMLAVRNFEHWFSRPVWRDLQSLRDGILSLNGTGGEAAFFLAVLSSIIRWVSNADDQSHKTYVSHTRDKAPPGVLPTFRKAVARAISGVRDLQAKRAPDSKAFVWNADATRTPLKRAVVDITITSPPYLDSVDYMYNFMLEYFWLGPLLGIQTRQSFNVRRRESLGAKRPVGKERELPQEIPLLGQLGLSPERRRAAEAYFRGMGHHFLEASRYSKKGAVYVLVIGNSQSRIGPLPVHDAMIRLAAKAGWSLEKAFGYRVRRHYMKFPRMGRGGIILIDWIIVLRLNPASNPWNESLPLPWATLPPRAVAN